MKKHILDLSVVSAEHIADKYVLLRLTSEEPLPEMLPGQFAELRVDDSPSINSIMSFGCSLPPLEMEQSA